MKKYSINGKTFELRPLSWKQQKLAKDVETLLRGKVFSTAQELAKEKDFEKINALALNLTEIVLDDNFPKFLATILVPEGEAWSEESIEKNAKTLEAMTEDVLEAVISDFLFRKGVSSDASRKSL